MKQKKLIPILVLIAIGISFLFADTKNTPHLGQEISSQEIAIWDNSIFPDGEGLPNGEGSVHEGEKIFNIKCLVCHGKKGLGHTADQLAGAQMSLTSQYPEKTIGSYWPYATTLFDFIRRSMPMDAPGSLTDNETYSLTAYLLYLNNIFDENGKMSAEELVKIKMPNHNGFINIYELEGIHK
tara:strand:- start:224 stop:769 length:546 start_codon:yes stop_codon:yes gene_type:complete